MHLDLLILSDSGNILDALFLASAAALHDTRVPRTRSIEYKAIKSYAGDRLTSENADARTEQSGQETRTQKAPVDFELMDYWDEGEPLKTEVTWPVCITLNLVRRLIYASRIGTHKILQLPPIHYLDATSMDESSISSRLMLLFSCGGTGPHLQGMRLLGEGELDSQTIKPLLRVGAIPNVTLSAPLSFIHRSVQITHLNSKRH